MTKGVERFRFVSPVFKQNMYSGVREEIPPNKSPVDLFHPNLKANFDRFPLLKEAVVHDVTLRPGECLYIPAWWWMQSKSVGWKADQLLRDGVLTRDQEDLVIGNMDIEIQGQVNGET